VGLKKPRRGFARIVGEKKLGVGKGKDRRRGGRGEDPKMEKPKDTEMK